MKLEERIKKLKKALEDDMITKETYEKNVVKLRKEAEGEVLLGEEPPSEPEKKASLAEESTSEDEEWDLGIIGAGKGPEVEDEQVFEEEKEVEEEVKDEEPAEDEEDISEEAMMDCPICGVANPSSAAICSDCGMDMSKEPEETKPEMDTLLEDLFKKDLLDEDTEDLELDDLSLPEVSEEETLDDFFDLLAEKETKPAQKPGKKVADEDELLIDELYDSLVFREEEFECPLCGADLPKSTLMCTNCNARLTEEGQLKEEVSIDILSSSIEDGLAELADLADDLISEEVEEAAPEVPTPEVPPETVEEVAEVKIPTKPIVEPSTTREVEGDITEEELPSMHLFGMKYVDFIVMGTVAALVLVFVLFKLYSWENLTTVSISIFFGIAIVGMAVTFFLFRISTSSIAEGDRLFKKGDYEGALLQYERAIKFSSRPATAWTSKGVAQKRFGDYEGALRSHNIALKLNPKNEIAWCNKGDLLFRLGKFEQALECYDNALDINPRYPIAWNNKGITLARLEKYDEAKKCQDVATRLKPKYAAAWVNKGEILAKLNRREEAIACYNRAKRLVAA